MASLERQQTHTINNSAKSKLSRSLTEKSELIRGSTCIFSYTFLRLYQKASTHLLFWILADPTLERRVPDRVSCVCLCLVGSRVLRAHCSLPDHMPHYTLVCTPAEASAYPPRSAATTAELRLPRGGRETLLARPNPNNSPLSLSGAHYW